MPLSVRFKLALSPKRFLNLARRDFLFFDEMMLALVATTFLRAGQKDPYARRARQKRAQAYSFSTLERDESSATKQMGLFQQLVEVRHGTRKYRPLSSPLLNGAVHVPTPVAARYGRGIYLGLWRGDGPANRARERSGYPPDRRQQKSWA
jgi:hypothetical protein